jgi:hypothetical protein
MKKIIHYRFLSTDDISSPKYKWWSRIYEYAVVEDFIMKTRNDAEISIHNTAWGTDDKSLWNAADDHVAFRNSLDAIKKSKNTHSDIIKSINYNTEYYDITKKSKKYLKKFDYVLNVSVVEHLNKANQIATLDNLYSQVKDGGYLILTFDYPRVDLDIIKKWLDRKIKCKKPDNLLNGSNSKKPNNKYKNLKIVYLVVQKK